MRILVITDVTNEDRKVIGNGQLASKRECMDELNFVIKTWLDIGRNARRKAEEKRASDEHKG